MTSFHKLYCLYYYHWFFNSYLHPLFLDYFNNIDASLLLNCLLYLKHIQPLLVDSLFKKKKNIYIYIYIFDSVPSSSLNFSNSTFTKSMAPHFGIQISSASILNLPIWHYFSTMLHSLPNWIFPESNAP